MLTDDFNGQNGTFLAVRPHSPNYASINFFEFFIMFAGHENIGKELKFMVLLFSDKDLLDY